MRFAKLVLLAAMPTLFGQQPTFEVATVKPSTPPAPGTGMRVWTQGGPGNPDPSRFRCDNCSVSMLVTMAYDLKRFQVSGPSWMESERFDITAKLPEGTTKEQFKLMQQALLAERFGLKSHWEKKDTAVYELVVAKNGPKLKDSAGAFDPKSMPEPGNMPKFTMGKDGFPELPAGRPMMIMMNGNAKRQGINETAEQLAAFLASQLDKRVTDKTGLTGKYDTILGWSSGGRAMPVAPPPPGGAGPLPPDAGDAGPSLQSALHEQLGLRLDAKKGQAEILVIDHLEKVPTEN